MDDIVRQALLKWPDVPDCRGWLRLTRRGEWRVPTGVIHHAGLTAFIGRNYVADEGGCWYFQNGPQKVFVSLDYMPWVLRLDSAGRLVTHTGLSVELLNGAWLDEEGSLLLQCEHGPAVLDDRDLAKMAESLAGDPEDGAVPLSLDWQGKPLPVGRVTRADAPARFSFVADPA